MNNIQNITEKTEIDETVEEYEYHSYEPITGTNLNNLIAGSGQRTIKLQDLVRRLNK